jgi:hypothetical protein
VPLPAAACSWPRGETRSVVRALLAGSRCNPALVWRACVACATHLGLGAILLLGRHGDAVRCWCVRCCDVWVTWGDVEENHLEALARQWSHTCACRMFDPDGVMRAPEGCVSGRWHAYHVLCTRFVDLGALQCGHSNTSGVVALVQRERAPRGAAALGAAALSASARTGQ